MHFTRPSGSLPNAAILIHITAWAAAWAASVFYRQGAGEIWTQKASGQWSLLLLLLCHCKGCGPSAFPMVILHPLWLLTWVEKMLILRPEDNSGVKGHQAGLAMGSDQGTQGLMQLDLENLQRHCTASLGNPCHCTAVFTGKRFLLTSSLNVLFNLCLLVLVVLLCTTVNSLVPPRWWLRGGAGHLWRSPS